jgi:hypothetical protein
LWSFFIFEICAIYSRQRHTTWLCYIKLDFYYQPSGDVQRPSD